MSTVSFFFRLFIKFRGSFYISIFYTSLYTPFVWVLPPSLIRILFKPQYFRFIRSHSNGAARSRYTSYAVYIIYVTIVSARVRPEHAFNCAPKLHSTYVFKFKSYSRYMRIYIRSNTQAPNIEGNAQNAARAAKPIGWFMVALNRRKILMNIFFSIKTRRFSSILFFIIIFIFSSLLLFFSVAPFSDGCTLIYFLRYTQPPFLPCAGLMLF